MTTKQSSTGATVRSAIKMQHFPPSPKPCKHEWSKLSPQSNQSCLECIREHASHHPHFSMGRFQYENENAQPQFRYGSPSESMQENIGRQRDFLREFNAVYYQT